MMAQDKVIVGMSGGVDSAVAAWLLKEQGYSVVGVFMKNWEDDDHDDYCTSREDLIDVASVADKIGIDMEVVNFAKEYKSRVFSYFLAEYQQGRTPNPDILCNSEIKFDCFYQYACSLGATKIATGHYAGVRQVDGIYQLLRAEDGQKDQSYFLHRLSQQQLSRVIFPLADLRKTQVRQIAAQLGLSVAEKKDSTGICFIGERPFKAFLQQYLPGEPGEIIDLDSGRCLGQHDGAIYFTIGQRKGLHIGGIAPNNGGSGISRGSRSGAATGIGSNGSNGSAGTHQPWFVAGKDIAKNIVYVVQGHQHPALFNDRLSAKSLHWCQGMAPQRAWVYTAKTRYRSTDAPVVITDLADGEDEMTLHFAQPEWAVTAGQSVVLYESRVCLGGGIIVDSKPVL